MARDDLFQQPDRAIAFSGFPGQPGRCQGRGWIREQSLVPRPKSPPELGVSLKPEGRFVLGGDSGGEENRHQKVEQDSGPV
jgi:hypothetical protein